MKKPKFLFPPVYLLIFLLMQWGISVYWPNWPLPEDSWLSVFKWGVGLVGVGLLLYSSFQIKRADTTIIPYEESDALVTEGLFAYSRNPIYLGMVMMLLATALDFGTWVGLALVPAFVVLIEWRFIRPEEAMLEATFGEPYRQYKAHVRRWI